MAWTCTSPSLRSGEVVGVGRGGDEVAGRWGAGPPRRTCRRVDEERAFDDRHVLIGGMPVRGDDVAVGKAQPHREELAFDVGTPWRTAISAPAGNTGGAGPKATASASCPCGSVDATASCDSAVVLEGAVPAKASAAPSIDTASMDVHRLVILIWLVLACSLCHRVVLVEFIVRFHGPVIVLRARNSAMVSATGWGCWMCRRCPTPSMVRSSTSGIECGGTRRPQPRAARCRCPARTAPAGEWPPRLERRTSMGSAGSSTPKNVSASLIAWCHRSGMRSSSSARSRHSSRSRR